MAFDNKDLIQEGVLFDLDETESPSKGAGVNEEVLFENSTPQHDGVFEEALFSEQTSSIEELSPIIEKEDLLEETLFDLKESAVEELLVESNSSIEELSPIIENEDLLEEALFNSSESTIEELSVEDGGYIAEENLTFAEPVERSQIDEEVLFNGNEEPVEINGVENNPSIISEELSSLSETSLNLNKPEYVEKNFAQKILESNKEILERYDELKNVILLYKGVKSRVSNDFDSFNKGRTQLFKLGFSTKSLKLYLNLDINEVEPRLKCKDVSHKKSYAQVPVFLRIKSNRAMKNAKYLIEKVVEKFDLKENPRAVYVDSIKILEEKAKTYDR